MNNICVPKGAWRLQAGSAGDWFPLGRMMEKDIAQINYAASDVPAKAADAARRAAMHATPAIRFVARVGYAAKGVVYLLVGGLSFLGAVGPSGETTGSEGAMRSVLEQPFGRVLLAVIAAGLAGYALWCFVRAIVDPEDEGNDAKGLAKRAFTLIKGVAHGALVLAAVDMVRGIGSSGGDDSGIEEFTAWLMSFPLGVWLVAAAGIGVAVYGLLQIRRAWRVDLDDRLNLGTMGATAHSAMLRVSRFGMAARGVVFGIIGGFLVVAAFHANPSQARGVGGALETLRGQPYGWVLLSIVALGLAAYGIYQLILARFRRIATR